MEEEYPAANTAGFVIYTAPAHFSEEEGTILFDGSANLWSSNLVASAIWSSRLESIELRLTRDTKTAPRRLWKRQFVVFLRVRVLQ